jgi:hypothetical protein
MSMFDGIMGAVDGIVGGLDGGAGGGNFLSELMDAFEGSGSQGSGGSNGTMSEIGQIAGDVLPLVAAFL